MPSAFDADFAAEAVPDFQDNLGEAATYTAPTTGAVAVSCTVIVGDESSDPLDTDFTRETRKIVMVKISRAEVDAPTENGVVTIGGTDYKVLRVHNRTGSMTEVACLRTAVNALVAKGRVEQAPSGGRGGRR